MIDQNVVILMDYTIFTDINLLKIWLSNVSQIYQGNVS